MSLIVTGSIGFDTVITPTGRADQVLGGSCTYFAAAASFFSPVRLVAAVGEDFSAEHRAALERFAGVDTAGLEVRRGSRTFRWTGRYEQNMNQRTTVEVQQNVLAEALPPVPPAYRDSRYVFLANTHPAGQLELRRQFPRADLVVADTMDLWLDTALDELKTLMRQIDGLVLNDAEAVQLTGRNNLVAASADITAMGPRFVVIKKGEHGCLLRHGDHLAVLPAWPAEQVVDPTGAGDSFAGAMMGWLADAGAGPDDLPAIKKALACGTIVASFTIESFSLDRLARLSRRDIDRRLDQFARLVRFT